MSDLSDDDRISALDMQELQKWLTAKTRGRPVACAVCQQSQWSVLDNFVALRAVSKRGEESGAAYPHVALTCSHCGHTILLNAQKSKMWR